MTTVVERLHKSQEMRLANAEKRRLNGNARAMYLAGAVKLARADFASAKANKGKGWV
jgi:hypothetical protein